MKTLFDPAAAAELQARLDTLAPTSQPLWGSMNVTQMLRHSVEGFKLPSGEVDAPRNLAGRIIGPLIKRRVLSGKMPFPKDAPTMPGLVSTGTYDFDAQRDALSANIARFTAAGPSRCGTHPHAFFGPMTAADWGQLAYLHLDHHFRQFGV